MKERNQTIDVFKYIAALMIVAIHTADGITTETDFGFFSLIYFVVWLFRFSRFAPDTFYR